MIELLIENYITEVQSYKLIRPFTRYSLPTTRTTIPSFQGREMQSTHHVYFCSIQYGQIAGAKGQNGLHDGSNVIPEVTSYYLIEQ